MQREACSCWRTPPGGTEVIPFGADLHLRTLRKRGSPYWWLRAAICDGCRTHWLVAQEERLNDVYILRRLVATEAEAIEGYGRWPTHLDRYETLLVIGKGAGHVTRFADPLDAQEIVRDLMADRSAISAAEIAGLVNLSVDEAASLMRLAARLP